tara:strand:- start:146 stop:406 length:261 start_codon:yes stop_codon:yes gene_type:complete
MSDKPHDHIISTTPGMGWHGDKVRLTILLEPDVAVTLSEKAGFEKVTSYIQRIVSKHCEDNSREEEVLERLDAKLHWLIDFVSNNS